MPRFFFHVHHGQSLPDQEGVELQGPDEARNLAVVACSEALRDLDGEFWKSGEWTMTVEDSDGTVVCFLKLSGRI